MPAGYAIDRQETRLGKGRLTFETACAAMRNWKMFDLPWVRCSPTKPPMAEGVTVVILARTVALWAVGVCRIVNVVDEPRRFGFAYGTLAHVEQGEERFLVEWREDDSVWYTILAFPRPGSWLTKIVYPYARYCQYRFRVDSAAAMQRAVTKMLVEGSGSD